MVIDNPSGNNMLTGGGFIVLEDNIMRLDSTFQLPANDSAVVTYPANGSTWAIFADQRPGYPGISFPMAATEGCGTDPWGNISKGFLPAYPQDDGDPYRSVHCFTWVGSYDPNDKMAFPVGLEQEHFLNAGSEIDYQIRFQNTGTWWAYEVVILDTLDPGLDLTTLRISASSHFNYEWSLSEGNILKVRFPDILLPPAGADSIGSQGFIRFKVSLKDSLDPGTIVYNDAAIYFDYNLPIYTNLVFHTIPGPSGGFFRWPEKNRSSLIAFPNPFHEEVTFRMRHFPQGTSTWSLYDLRGILLRRLSLPNTSEFTFSDPSLPAGVYIYRMESPGQEIMTGKIILRR